MVKILHFDSDRELSFDFNRGLWFDPDDGLWFNHNRILPFDPGRALPFGINGVMFRALVCSACGKENYHIAKTCAKCGWHLNQAEVQKEHIPKNLEEAAPMKRSPVRKTNQQPAMVKPVQARPVQAELADRPAFQPVKKPQARAAPRVRPVQPPRPRPQAGIHARTQARPVQSPRPRPRARPQAKPQGDTTHCSSCGVRVSRRHPYCWNCSHPIGGGSHAHSNPSR